MFDLRPRLPAAVCAAVALLLIPSILPARGASERLERLLEGIPREGLETGILYERVLPMSGLESLDGDPDAPAVEPVRWRQAYSEIRRAGRLEEAWPLAETLARRAHDEAPSGGIRIAVLNCLYDRIRPDAVESGALVHLGGRLAPGAGDPTVTRRVTAAAPLVGTTHRGEDVVFRFDPEDHFTNDPRLLRSIEFDPGDGSGPADVAPGGTRRARYREAGEKTIRLRLRFESGPDLFASARFEVRGLRTPSPNDTLQITASIPYMGAQGTGQGFVYLAPGHAAIENPILVIEGFDLDNTMGWDELYELLNQQQLIETIRSMGYDAVVLNFTDSVTYIQRNAFVAVELIQQIRSVIAPERTMAVIGASLGGLVGRYALAYMETNGLPHSTRTFISFDSPQNGATIPLGIQYWLWFFQDDSDEAAALLAALDTPGARQMLVYHHTDPPGGTGQADPLRAQLLSDLDAVGDYPTQLRKVAVANGSGFRWSQGFAAGVQIISWEYTSFLVDVTGNVWAVPDGGSQRIFEGLIDIIFVPEDRVEVTVSGTRPFDNSPGGWRDSMAEMDAVEAPYGDIIALHPNHCFIPTVSSLGLDTQDLFFDIANDPDILAHTPFDAVYFPSTVANQEHVLVTAESAEWFLTEIQPGASGAAEILPADGAGARIESAGVNPSDGRLRLRLTIPQAGPARVALYDAKGARIAVLADQPFVRGAQELPPIDLREVAGPVAAGVYFLSLQGDGYAASGKVQIQ